MATSCSKLSERMVKKSYNLSLSLLSYVTVILVSRPGAMGPSLLRDTERQDDFGFLTLTYCLFELMFLIIMETS